MNNIKAVFEWGVKKRENKKRLVEPETFDMLKIVDPIKKEQTAAYEPKPIDEIEDSIVLKTMQYLMATPKAMIALRRSAGMRPQDVCQLRFCDIHVKDGKWVYATPEHKTAFRNKERSIYFNIQERAIIEERSSGKPADDYVFSPIDTMREIFPKRKTNPHSPSFYQFT